MRTPSSQTCRLDLAPPLADRFILGFPIDYGPVLLLMPFRFHLTVDTLPSGLLQSGGSRSVLAISSFRLRARLDVFIPSTLSGQRGYEPRFWIWRPSFERQRDFNSPEQCAAQRTCPYCRQTRNKATEGRSQDLSGILSLETHATPIESPNRATQWRGIRRAAFNRCLAEVPGFLYQLYFPLSWKEVHQFIAHDSTTTSPSLGPDAMETCLRPAEDSFCRYHSLERLSGQAAALRRTRQTR